MEYKIGFMQGRLSPMQGKKIQSFPWKNWKKEFQIGNKLDFKILEWILDYQKLYYNPLMTDIGRRKIKKLCLKYNFEILSLTGDCFMQKPFWKVNGQKRNKLQNDFLNIIKESGKLGIKFIILPLVDNGKVVSQKQEEILINFIKKIYPTLRLNKIKILFESDFEPKKYLKFIKKFDHELVGINYDTGNSASYGFNPDEEISLYGKYINNVHIKDRFYKGNTVPLGEGNVDFQTVFEKLKQIKYKGNFILQGARSKKNRHAFIIKKYKDFMMNFLAGL
jgi:hexulose-6-phosphate isomerase|tara:strand:- start:3119 stop:3952 length:834 start_codon:yes stop_codon:yes gene_type:complete